MTNMKILLHFESGSTSFKAKMSYIVTNYHSSIISSVWSAKKKKKDHTKGLRFRS